MSLIYIDIDGTLTNFEKFVLDNSKDYMKKKYNFELTNYEGYDIDEMYNLKNVLAKKYNDEEKINSLSKKIVNDFWKTYYLKYALFEPYKKNSVKSLNKLYYEGIKTILLSSRNKACNNDF